jgi:hypothetical protein
MAVSAASKAAKKLIAEALKTLEGDWVLVGGALMLVLGAGKRATQDIDLVALDEGAGASQQLRLFELAEKLGLPVEAVNSAAGYFLRKIRGYRAGLELMAEGKRVRIYRPNPALYLKLKAARLTESDLQDCLSMLEWARRKAPAELERCLPDLDRFSRSLEAGTDARGARLRVLVKAIHDLLASRPQSR